jgi:hypothetical protein
VPSRTETTVGPPNLVDVDFFRSPSGARSLRPKTTSPNPAGAMDLTGTVLQIDDELLVVVQATPEPQTSNAPSRASSRPPSRAPSRPPSANVDGPTREKSLARKASRRMRPSSPTTLDRKTSMNRRNSLPTFTPKPSPVTVDVNNSDKPLRIVVHAATLDRMVRLLIFGLERVVVSSSDDSGETSLRERSSRQLQLDAEEFAETWWFGFRTFVTPLVFFEVIVLLMLSASDCTDLSLYDSFCARSTSTLLSRTLLLYYVLASLFFESWRTGCDWAEAL